MSLQPKNRKEEKKQIAIWVGQRIAKLRQERKLTQVDCSKQAHLAKSHLSQIESGKRIPSLEKLFDLCQVLRVKMADIFVHQELGVDEEKCDQKRKQGPQPKKPL